MRRAALSWGIALATLGSAARDASACQVLEVRFRPSANLQIAIWIERADGGCLSAGPSGTDCVETVYLTRLTGRYGLGNRPGRFDFNSNYRWPMGRRTSVLPVW